MPPTYNYEESESCETTLIYFILNSSRTEPAMKRVHIIISASKLAGEKDLHRELYDLGCELMDVEQTVQKYIGELREALGTEPCDDRLHSYLLERIEDAPLSLKIDLLGAIPALKLPGSDARQEAFRGMHREASRFQKRFETLMFRLRTRYYGESNRAVRAAWALEEAAKAATVARAI